MKIVLTSDLHFKTGQYMDIYLNDYEGIYYPMQNLLYAAEICKKENADYLFILGDIFDRSNNSHFLVDCIGRALEMISKTCKTVILLGNHDIELKQKNLREYYSTLRLYNKLVTVIEEPYVDHQEKIVMIPYNYHDILVERSLDDWKDYILFTHIGINGFEYATGMKSYREPVNPEALSKFSMVVSGHYHLHSFSRNIYYLGSPWCVRSDELGTDKYIHVIDTDTLNIKKFKSIYSQLVEIPVEKIDDIKLSELEKLFVENPYAKVKLILKDVKLINSIDTIVKEFGLSRIYYSVEEKVEKLLKSESELKSNTSISLSVENLLKDYFTEEEKSFVEKVILEVEEFLENEEI
ncbi:MAG: metallophosphoesterase [Candidatus Kryptonium sp.]